MEGPRSIAALAACALAVFALGCASYSAPAERPEVWADAWKQRASRAATGAARGARAVGGAAGTAFHGVVHGFEDPDEANFGRYPARYAETIRSHMTRFQGVPADASFRFGRPQKGYLNKGILAGGRVAWQGYLVEVEVLERSRFASQTRPEAYVVRMRDGAVVEVIDAAYAGALRWTDPAAEPGARAARD